jgi:hypothetical protein
MQWRGLPRLRRRHGRPEGGCRAVVVLGTIPLVASLDIAAATLGALNTEGVFDVAKTTDTFTAGDAVYWKTTADPVGGTAGTGAAQSSATGSNLMGVAVADAATGATTVRVKLTAAKRTTTIAGSVTADDITGSDSTLTISGLASTTGGTVTIAGGSSSTGAVAGAAVSMTGGTGGAAGAGGAASVVGGIPASGNAAGGAAALTGGAGSGTGAGGATSVTGGASGGGATGNGGAITLTGGAAVSTAGNGGAASLIGGVSTTTGTGGALTLRSGASVGASGTAGAVILDAGAAAGGTGAAVEIGPTNATGVKIGGAGSPSERALIKGKYVSGTVVVAVPSITDPDIAKVDVDVSAMTFAPAVGDSVIAIPLEALPTNCRLGGAWVSATDTVTITFGSEGGNVTGANKNFKFL